jgi:hypothetical protein
MVDCFELERPPSFVGIACLSCLGRCQIGLDVVDYLFSLNDKVKTKDRPLTRLDPVHRCIAAMTIQSFERCHLETLLVTIVVRELSQWQTLVPFARVIQYTSSKHIFKNLIHPLCLTIGLWMISQAVDPTCPQGSMQLLPEASDKLGPRSEMMVFGTPCRHRMRETYNSSYFSAL